MGNGWIKLHRKLWDNPIVTKDPDHLAVWIYLLTNATHKDYYILWSGKKKKLKPGQLITGRKTIAQITGVNESKVKRIINLLKSDQQIDQQTNRHGSLITIVNWDKYQLFDQQNDQQMTNNWPTSDQQVTTNNNIKNKRIKESSRSENWLSDHLTEKEWDRLKRTFVDVPGLIDYVDNQITDTEEIEKPYQYILAVAERKGWKRKKEV